MSNVRRLKAMQSTLESFYSIDEWSIAEGELIVRFVPDFLSTEIAEPVVTVSVLNPHNRQDAEAGLQGYAKEMIVDIRASETALEVWGEYDDAPFTVVGREARLVRSAYSSLDLAKAIEQLQTQLSSSQAAELRLRYRMNEVESFVVDLLNRAQARKAMSSRNTSPSDAQIDALSRVLSHIRDP
jgi:hypothetical protein